MMQIIESEAELLEARVQSQKLPSAAIRYGKQPLKSPLQQLPALSRPASLRTTSQKLKFCRCEGGLASLSWAPVDGPCLSLAPFD
eukprot:7705301-Karenia_brevis.AAC.2